MATNVVSSQFLDLPDDILLEILARLPASSIIMHCRLVCRRMDQLSRNSHLWVQYLNHTKDALRPPINPEQIGTVELERILYQTERLKEKWGNDSALQIAPRFWRSAAYGRKSDHGIPVGIMGDYIIFERFRRHKPWYNYSWVSMHDHNRPLIFNYEVRPRIDIPARCRMDSGSKTFYVVFIPEGPALTVLGFRANTSVPHKEFEYQLPLRNSKEVHWLRVKDGYAYVDYKSLDGIEMDVIELGERTISRFNLPSLSSLLHTDTLNGASTYGECIATKTHLIYIISWTESAIASGMGFAAFRRPTDNMELQQSNSSNWFRLQETVHLHPTIRSNFAGNSPYMSYIIPRSLTSFVVVGIWKNGSPMAGNCEVTIRILSFTFSGEQPSIKEIGSTIIPGRLIHFTLPVPPTPIRYALGVLGVQQIGPAAKGIQEGLEYFAVKILFPSLEQNPTPGKDSCQITLARMRLAPAIDELKETELHYFDHFSGKVLLTARRFTAARAEVVIDYLPTVM